MVESNLEILTLKGYNCFSPLYKSGKRFSTNKGMALVIFKTVEPETGALDRVFCGISTSRKYSKSSVIRNRTKRLIREALRIAIAENLLVGEPCPFDKIVAAWRFAPKTPKELTLADVLKVFRVIIKDAATFYTKHKSEKKSEVGNITNDKTL